MRYSTNLNIILRAITNATNHIPRDITELENLQNNPVSAYKFAVSCCQKIKKTLLHEFSKFRPDYDLLFCDHELISRNSSASEYRLIVNFIDGFENLVRANGDFTISVALQHKNQNEDYGNLAAAVFKVVGNEIYYGEKGFGCYVNNRRLRIAKRNTGKILVATNNPAAIPQNSENQQFFLRCYGSKTLEIAYLAASRLDRVYLSKSNGNIAQGSKLAGTFAEELTDEFITPFFLLISEAGGMIKKSEVKPGQSAQNAGETGFSEEVIALGNF